MKLKEKLSLAPNDVISGPNVPVKLESGYFLNNIV